MVGECSPEYLCKQKGISNNLLHREEVKRERDLFPAGKFFYAVKTKEGVDKGTRKWYSQSQFAKTVLLHTALMGGGRRPQARMLRTQFDGMQDSLLHTKQCSNICVHTFVWLMVNPSISF